MRRLLITQLSDLHLGASVSGGRLALPPRKAEQRRAERRACLERFAQHVRGSRPDMVLMPGDLFDSPEPSIDDLNFLIAMANLMGPTPVFVAPGNHDGYAPSSGYNPHSALYQSRGGGPKWGSHVRVFTGEAFETLPMPHHPDVTVTAAAFHRHTPDGRRALAELAPPPPDGCHILLFHGSLQNYPRQGADKEVLPFTAEELAAAGYAYAAVGHYHRGGPIVGEAGRVLGAYAGAPFAAGLDDEGAGTWLEVQLDPRQPLADDALAWHRCDPRAVRRVALDVTGLTDTTALEHRLDQALAEAGAADDDIVYVELAGRITRGIGFGPEPALRERFFHAVVSDAKVEPDYAIDLDGPLGEEPGLAATSEEMFRWRMHRLYHDAATDDERARVKDALFYGLDALTLGEIHLR